MASQMAGAAQEVMLKFFFGCLALTHLTGAAIPGNTKVSSKN
jgi:hypothetical protein